MSTETHSQLDIAKRQAGGDEIVPDLELVNFVDNPPSCSPRRIHSAGPSSWKDRYQQIARSRTSSVGSRTMSTASSPASAYLSRINSRLSISSSSERPLPTVEQEVGFDENDYSYKLGAILGKGGFSVVRKAVRNDKKVVALKIVDKRAGDIHQEIDIWKSLRHENILPLLSVHETTASYYLVTNCFSDGTLFDLVRNNRTKLPLAQLRRYLKQLVSAVVYMHSLGILHRDIKPENCLLDAERQNLLLSDFGLSEYADSVDVVSSPQMGPSLSSASLPATVTSNGGSFLYASPELLDGMPGYACDIWALGVVFYICMTGSYPWQHSLLPKLKQMIREDNYDDSKLPEDTKGIVKALLNRDLEKRPTARAIEEMISQYW